MSKSSETPVFHITEDVKKQFRETRDMLDQILETFEILEDRELMKRIKESEEEFARGETTSLEELKEELE